jgi:hypothetical protein
LIVFGYITLFYRLLLDKVAREENLAAAAATHVDEKTALADQSHAHYGRRPSP